MVERKQVTMYTDGACTGNPGPGGYGTVLIYGERRNELSAGYRLTTNNRMELTAVIEGLRKLRIPCDVTVFSDSKYVVDAVNEGWVKRWRANDWKRNKKESAVNADLWARLLNLTAEHNVEFRWVKGHSGDPENERCDQLAVQAAQQLELPTDEGYESPPDYKLI